MLLHRIVSENYIYLCTALIYDFAWDGAIMIKMFGVAQLILHARLDENCEGYVFMSNNVVNEIFIIWNNLKIMINLTLIAHYFLYFPSLFLRFTFPNSSVW